MIQDGIKKLLAKEALTQSEASAVMNSIMSGEATPAQIAGFLVALRVKGETAQEVVGFVQSMRNYSVRIQVNDVNAIDGCGTGGDGKGSFNISTAASIVAAAAGATVAKHGNRSISSKCGSADLLETCGGAIDPGPEQVTKAINDIGFGFMFAPRFHPAMKHAAGPRKELGVRTVFNILGPMTNPAGVKRQVIGVYDASLMPLVAEVLAMTGSEYVLVVHSRDGHDEISANVPTDFIELKQGKLSNGVIDPNTVLGTISTNGELSGGDAAHNHQLLIGLLGGDKGQIRNAVIINAAALLYVADRTASIKDGIFLAEKAIDSGAAKVKLAEWVKVSHE